MSADDGDAFAALLSWAGPGTLHPAVEIYRDETTGASLRVKPGGGRGLDPGPVVTLPLSRSLSYLNAVSGHPEFPEFPHIPGPPSPSSSPSSAPPPSYSYFPAGFLRAVPPHVIGRFFLVQQYLLGAGSPWWPYVRTLPQPAAVLGRGEGGGGGGGLLPCTWSDADVSLLRGTNAHVAVSEIRASLAAEYDEAMRALQLASPSAETVGGEYTRDLYTWAYCIFTSRSFRPSLILPEGSTRDRLPCRVDDFSVLLPVFDIANHDPRARTSWTTTTTTTTTPNATTISSSTDSTAVNNTQQPLCHLVTAIPYGPGQQVYNNYGLKTNAELLLGYGFVLPEDEGFHNDYVHVRTRATDPDGSGAGGNDMVQLRSTHLVSLRPVVDERSLVGRARSVLLRWNSGSSGGGGGGGGENAAAAAGGQEDEDEEEQVPVVLSPFSHVQDTLVVSLLGAVCRALGRAPPVDMGTTLVAGRGEENMRLLAAVMRGDPEVLDEDVLDEVINALGTKLSMDLEEIERGDPVGEEEVLGRQGNSYNKDLALRYRERCKEVLGNALESLG